MASYFGEACRRLGYESHYFSMPDGKLADGIVDYYHEINIFEKEKITEICKEIGVDGIVATTELSVAVAAYVAEQLGLLGLPYEVAQVITNKYRNEFTCRKCINGVPIITKYQCVKQAVKHSVNFRVLYYAKRTILKTLKHFFVPPLTFYTYYTPFRDICQGVF
jgi:hypothetical protein